DPLHDLAARRIASREPVQIFDGANGGLAIASGPDGERTRAKKRGGGMTKLHVAARGARQAIAHRDERVEGAFAIARTSRLAEESIERALRQEVSREGTIPPRIVGDEERTRAGDLRECVFLRRPVEDEIARK